MLKDESVVTAGAVVWDDVEEKPLGTTPGVVASGIAADKSCAGCRRGDGMRRRPFTT